MKRRKRLLFVSPSAYPLGGVATWLDYLLPRLEARGWECILALASGRNHDYRVYLADHPWPRAMPLRNESGSREGRIQALIHAVQGCAPDWVINTGLADLYSAVARLHRDGEWRRLRLISTQHTLQSDFLDDLISAWPLVAAAVCTNRLTQQAVMQATGADATRVLYAPYGVHLKHDQVPEKQLEGTFKLGFAGRLEQSQKRVLDVAEIVHRCHRMGLELELYIAGEGPSAEALAQALAGYDLTSRVTWLGSIKPQAMASEFYARIDALLITSQWETGPIVAWEAMAAGVPVVASRYLGSGAEGALVHERTALLYPLAELERAAMQIGRLISTPELYHRLAQRAWDMVCQRYSIDASVLAWCRVLEQIEQHGQAVPGTVADPFPPTYSGRLDQWLGVARAERCRRLLGRHFNHQEPGSEWPHAYSKEDQSKLMNRLEQLDCHPAEAALTTS